MWLRNLILSSLIFTCVAGAQTNVNGLPNQQTPSVTVSGNGSASTAPLSTTGTWYQSGGSGTTTFPYDFMQPSGTTAVTTWSTTGTAIGANAPSGFTGNFLDFHVNGGASVYSVSSAGNITANYFNIGSGSLYQSPGASASALTFSGAPYASGTGTTSFPLLYLNDGTGPTTFASTGTEIGVNSPSGFTGNFLDFHVNGGSPVFTINSAGTILASGNTNILTATPSTITSTTAVTTTLSFPVLPATASKIGHCDILWSQATGGTSTFSLNTSAAPTDVYAYAETFGAPSTIVTSLPVTITTATTTTVTAATTDSTAGTLNRLSIHVHALNGATANTITVFALVSSGSDALTISKGSACVWEP
jgi:hypothetical protein